MALSATLPFLTTREAVQDALYRCVLGLDNPDIGLFKSAFTEDASFDLNGNVMSGFNAIKSGCYDTISKLDTTHFITNTRISVHDDGSTATATASALAQHYRQHEGQRPGAARLLTGCLYEFDVAKDAQDELWKIKHWKLKIIWTEGDASVITGE